MPDGSRVTPTWDARQVGDTRLSSVQYLTFAFGREPPAAIGIAMPGAEAEAKLSQSQREALRADLRSD
jgi:hypothetical protein